MKDNQLERVNQQSTLTTTTPRQLPQWLQTMPSVNERGVERLQGLKANSPTQALDLRVFAAVNYTGPSLRKLPEENQFLALNEILVTISAMNAMNPPLPQTAALLVETIVENYGHFRPEEIKLAMTSALMGRIEGAPRTFAKINLEWIGGVLAAYETARNDSLARVTKRLPALPDRDEGVKKEDVEAYFWELSVSCVNGETIPIEAQKILPEIFVELEEWTKLNLGGLLSICDERRRQIYAEAQDIIKKNDERAKQFESTKENAFNATIFSMKKDKTKDARAKRLAREIACRELISYFKKYGIKIPFEGDREGVRTVKSNLK